MRIRTIKPEFWTNERMAALPEFSRLLALGLLNYADDHGYFNANTALIRGALFPFGDSSKLILGSLQDLSRVDYIRLATAPDGRNYGWIVHFADHQRVDKPKPSTIKGLCDFQDASKTALGLILDASKEEGKGREQGTGKGGEAEVATLPFQSLAFAAAWENWESSRKQKRKPITDAARKLQFRKLAAMTETRAIAALEHSTSNDYQGIFEPHTTNGTHQQPHKSDPANKPGRYKNPDWSTSKG